MLENIKNTLFKKKTFIISGIVFLIFLVVVLPVMASISTRVIGVSESPDLSFTLSLGEYYQMLNAYGEAGRRFYILLRWTFDLIWPFVYLCFLISSIGYLGKEYPITKKYLLYLPILGFIFDIFENSFATIVMAIYPKEIDIFIYLLQASTILKWFFIILSFIAILFVAQRKIRTKV